MNKTEFETLFKHMAYQEMLKINPDHLKELQKFLEDFAIEHGLMPKERYYGVDYIEFTRERKAGVWQYRETLHIKIGKFYELYKKWTLKSKFLTS